jgi:transcriptional regulator with XRE-family HTH domain
VSLCDARKFINQLSADFVMLSNSDERYIRISGRLREERKRLGLSQADLANALDISVRAYGGYEKAQVIAPLSVLVTLEDLGADTHYIVSGERSLSKLSPEDDQLLSAFRSATAEAQSAILAAATALSGAGIVGKKPKPATTQIFHGEVGQMISGDINAKQTFNFKK